MQTSRIPRKLFVRSLNPAARHGWLDLGHTRIPCVLGRSGKRAQKREGDGATPHGVFQVLFVFFRPDRHARPLTPLPVQALHKQDGWCDAPNDRNYNRPVQHPYPASAERLWRDDQLYDFIGVLDHNMDPRRRNLGSAIFLHLAHPERKPTEGCIAVELKDMKRVLALLGPDTKIYV